MSNANLIWGVLFLPIIGFLIQAFFGGAVIRSQGPKLGRKIMGTLAVLPIAIAFVLGAMVTQQLASMPEEGRHIVATLFQWIDIAGFKIPFEFLIDPLSMTMVLIITGIGSLIHLYATGYMGEEKDYSRFFTYLNLFIASMLILVLGNNLVMMFVGWEGVGLCSYLLIGFWYKDLANSKAANKAFIVNRIGDWGFSLGIFLLAVVVGAQADQAQTGGRVLSFDVMLSVIPQALTAHPYLATTIGLLLFVGACGKSAQFPLYLWLPDAMAGPTPVSALIHAATMVTSGVVLLNRMHIVFENSPIASAVVACVGAFTALFAALVAFGQTDIKKVLAYSTVSQLGFMFVACGAGAYWVGMFHVTTHAFFKALLFLGSGAVIHAMAHNQDMRNYGQLRKYLPITCWTMFTGFVAIAGLSIPGVFGFAGYYSKEAIIVYALANNQAAINGVNLGYYAGWTALFVALLTAFYMTRMTWLTFFGKEERWKLISVHDHTHEEHHALEGEHTPVANISGHDTSHDAPSSNAHGAVLAAAELGGAHADLADEHHHTHDHGSDVHGFFYTDQQVHEREHGEHEHEHHELDGSHKPHEVPPSMWLPLVILAIPSALAGWYFTQNNMFERWLEPSSGPQMLKGLTEHPEHLPGALSLVAYSAIAAFGGLAIGALIYWKGLPRKEGWDERKWSPFRRAAKEQFAYDRTMLVASVEGGNDLGRAFWKFDSGIVDGLVNAAAWFAGQLGDGFKRFQTGYARAYALMMLFGAVCVLGWFAYASFMAGGGR